MKQVSFGKTGVQVSAMCLGTMMFGVKCDEAETGRILDAALAQGVNWVDTAVMYAEGRTEEMLGRVLKGRRHQVFLATKVHKGVDARSIRESLDESLARLQTDHVDLYMIHWPRAGMRPQEMMEALDSVVRQGKARHVGCCNFSAWLFAHFNAIAARNGWAPLICNQIPYNLIERGVEVEILPQAVAEGVAIVTYRPLLMGILAGRYAAGSPLPGDSRGATDARIATWLGRYGEGLRLFEQFAAQRGIAPAHLAVAWLRHSPGVTAPVVGVSSVSQFQANLAGFDVDLSAEEYAQVTGFFDTAVKEEAGGRFPELRRATDLVG